MAIVKNINYPELLSLEKQVINSQNFNLPIYSDYAYKKTLDHKQVAPEQLWHDDTEMLDDFDFILSNPLVIHWIFEETGANFAALDLTVTQKLTFYRQQTNLFVKALMILVRDATPFLSASNFEALKASLVQNRVQIS